VEVLVGAAVIWDIPDRAGFGEGCMRGVGDTLAEAMMETTIEAERS